MKIHKAGTGEDSPSSRMSFKKAAIAAVVMSLIVVVAFFIFQSTMPTPEPKFSMKAAIVDQLGNEFPNKDFNETGLVANILKDRGFTVSYFKSQDVNVTFYRKLASSDYGVIVLRCHAALRLGQTLVDLFSSERYSYDAYSQWQDDGWLTKADYIYSPGQSYFAITYKFIENLDGTFPKSIIIAMGCNSLNSTSTETAQAFINKGAIAYIGWTGMVDASHTDAQTVKLVQALFFDNESLADAVDPMQSTDPTYGSQMNFLPGTAGNLTVASLIAGAREKSSSLNSLLSASTSFSYAFFASVCMIILERRFRFSRF